MSKRVGQEKKGEEMRQYGICIECEDIVMAGWETGSPTCEVSGGKWTPSFPGQCKHFDQEHKERMEWWKSLTLDERLEYLAEN